MRADSVFDTRRLRYGRLDSGAALADVLAMMDAVAPKTLHTPEDLVAAGLIAPDSVTVLHAVTARYATAIPPSVQDVIAVTGRDGPIARQFVPNAAELRVHTLERSDPIGDAVHAPVKGIVHRYPDRVLLMPTLVCAVYCRFCFRREVVGPDDGMLSTRELDAAMDYIAGTPAIWEVILTGGDPLVLSARRLADIAQRLRAIPHVKVLRVHTRVPIAAPERVDAATISALRSSEKTIYVAVHCNHPAELTPEAIAACTRLSDAGISLLSQSVLLAGVNDSVDTLEKLMRELLAARIKPYYLHQLDLAPGTSHFRVSVADGQAIMRALKARLSGIAMPTYVLDLPGGHGKVPIGPRYIAPQDAGYAVEDPAGLQHSYPPPEG